MSDNFFAELDSELGHVPQSEPSVPPARPAPIPYTETKKPLPPHIQKPKPQLKPTTPMMPAARSPLPANRPVPRKPMVGKPML